MDKPWKYYAKWNKPDTKGQVLFDSTFMRCLEQLNSETESALEATRGCVEGNRELLNGHRASVWDAKIVVMVAQHGECI